MFKVEVNKTMSVNSFYFKYLKYGNLPTSHTVDIILNFLRLREG